MQPLQRQSKEVNIGQTALSVVRNVKQALGVLPDTLKQSINVQSVGINFIKPIAGYNLGSNNTGKV